MVILVWLIKPCHENSNSIAKNPSYFTYLFSFIVSARPAMSVACKLLEAFTSLLLTVTSLAELPRLEHSLKDDGSLSLLVIGDWERKGKYNLSLVAAQVYYSSTLFLFFHNLFKLSI